MLNICVLFQAADVIIIGQSFITGTVQQQVEIGNYLVIWDRKIVEKFVKLRFLLKLNWPTEGDYLLIIKYLIIYSQYLTTD